MYGDGYDCLLGNIYIWLNAQRGLIILKFKSVSCNHQVLNVHTLIFLILKFDV